MDTMFPSLKKRQTWLITVPVLVGLVAIGVWFCVPAVRLAVHAGHLQSIPKAASVTPAQPARWVDAHRYDSEWFDAARAGRVDILQALVEAHYPIDTQTASGYSALILASYDEQPQALAYLMQRGANACLRDRNGNTALMGALYKGHDAIARTLLDHGHCPIDQANNAGETALSFAALFGRLEMLKALVAKGADLGHVDAQGDTALMKALKQGNDDVAGALREMGAAK